MHDGEVLAVCARDAIAEVFHRSEDLGRGKEGEAILRELLTTLVFSGGDNPLIVMNISEVLRDQGGELDCPLSG